MTICVCQKNCCFDFCGKLTHTKRINICLGTIGFLVNDASLEPLLKGQGRYGKLKIFKLFFFELGFKCLDQWGLFKIKMKMKTKDNSYLYLPYLERILCISTSCFFQPFFIDHTARTTSFIDPRLPLDSSGLQANVLSHRPPARQRSHSVGEDEIRFTHRIPHRGDTIRNNVNVPTGNWWKPFSATVRFWLNTCVLESMYILQCNLYLVDSSYTEFAIYKNIWGHMTCS